MGRTMRAGLVSLLLLASALPLGSADAQGDDMAQVETAARRLAELTSYSFRVSYELTGIPLTRNSYVVTGRWERGIAHLSAESSGGAMELYLMNGRAVFRKPGGQWTTGSPDGAGRPEKREGMRLPHEDLANLRTTVKSLSRSGRSGLVNSKVCVIYAGDLTAQGERDLIPASGIRVETAQAQGKVEIWIDEDGIIRKYTPAGNPRVVFLGRRFNLTVAKTTEISEINEAPVRPPSEVMRLLGAAR